MRTRRIIEVGVVSAVALGVAATFLVPRWLAAERIRAQRAQGGVELTYSAEGLSLPGDELVRRVSARLASLPELAAVGVRWRGERLVLEVPAMALEAAGTLKTLLRRPGRLAFREVDDGAALAAETRRIADPEVELREEHWRGVDERDHQGAMLTSKRLAALERVRAQLRLPADIEPLIEPVTLPSDVDDRPRDAGYLRVVRREGGLDGGIIAEAHALERDYGVEVRCKLTPAGGKAFEALTRRLVDRKLAIVVDDAINSTPLVRSAIAGGSVSITLGGGRDRATQLREATALAATLQSGELPRLTLLVERQVQRFAD